MKSIFKIFTLILFSFTFVYTQDQIDFRKHLEILASDAFEGRKPGDLGCNLAADYIKNTFKKIGLEPINNSYEQNFEVVNKVKILDDNKFVFNNINYTIEKDFIPLSFSANTSIKTEVVFVGYGLKIKNNDINWNSYTNIDVRGKWVMMLVGDPENDKADSKFTKYSSLRLKTILAKDLGALGVIFVQGAKISKKDELLPITFDKSESKADIAVLNITRKLANEIISGYYDKKIEEIELLIDSLKKPISFEINKKIFANINITLEKVNTKNILGMIDNGYDNYIIIGAHYDHLGLGGHGSGSRKPDTIAIHNGADDNASGVAGIIKLAEMFIKNKSKLKSNFIFIAFSAEEMGTLGSKYFIKSNLVPLNKIKFMVNLDMIGRLKDDNSLMIGGTGTAKEFDEVIDEITKKTDFKIAKSPEGFGASDHSSFYSENIPVLFFTTGAHEDYHKPSDDIDKINFIGMDKVIKIIYKITDKLQSKYNNLTFQIAGPQFRRGGGRYKVTLGFMPDFTSTNDFGVLVGGVTPNSPAHLGGLQKNDIIIALNGKQTKDIYEYMARLNELEPGQQITVDVLRNGEKIVLIIQL